MKQSLNDRIKKLNIVPKPNHLTDVLPCQNERENTLYETGYNEGFDEGFKAARQHLLRHLNDFVNEFGVYVHRVLSEEVEEK